ncbi:hypothetical protein HU200_015465 [Digitaria exilis]|uniref:Receptor-like serine/threonine-protein kinase n=1 Tax=Digitaria exilis TaxID=1010633 RepID=A0A835FBH1_9POAL|nr:hypothetical protein HU200_015465 [Digitaria exilis]
MATGRIFSFNTVLLSLFLTSSIALANDILERGSSISTGDDTITILVSADGVFSCGFYKVATNAFTFSIWFSQTADKTIAWTANRDTPVNGKGSRITFRKDGNLALVDRNGTDVWSTYTTATGARYAQLLDTGNLVVWDTYNKSLWGSFNSPTDTLLPSQPMTRNTKLILNNRTTYNNSLYGCLDDKGQFVASDNLRFQASDSGHDQIRRRLTLDYDGNLRLYSLNTTSGDWSVSWMAFHRVCEIHGLCGINSLCSCVSNLESCSCLEGFEMTKPGDWSKGCKRKINSTASQDFSFRKLPGIDFWGYDFGYTSQVPWDLCRNMCLDSGNCQAFGYREGTGECYLKTFLFRGKDFPKPYNDIYLKVTKTVLSLPQSPYRQSQPCKVTEVEVSLPPLKKFKFGYILSSALTVLVIEVTLIIAGCLVVYKWERRQEVTDEGYMIISTQFRRFSYKELQKATKCFQEELGSGRSGSVYKGILDDERNIAVKKLNDVVQGEQEFRSELSVIGRIYHMNLVRIWGFCAEKSHRLLISEFVKNGSLDRALFDIRSSSPVLQWSQRYNIALGVAKGLAYLHHECLEWIVHCDIKPENILLDGNFEPKIADFGLVKLLGQGAGAQMLSRVCGTRGYIAPEWALNLPITGMADVYSYGVVLLELVMGTRVSSQVVQGEGQVEMAVGLHAKILKEKLAIKDQSWLLEFVDCRLNGEFDYLQAAMMLKLAVSCVEEERTRRPKMNYVVKTLLSLVE